MSTRQIRPSSAVITCDFCHRTLLRGESSVRFYAHGEARTVCALCQPEALRGGWRRERSERDPEPRATTAGTGASLLDRLRSRNGTSRPGASAPEAPPRRVVAQPTGAIGRTKAALDSFNASPLTSTVSGIAGSLGEPRVAVNDHEDRGVDITVVWDLCWYRWRVESGPGGATISEHARGYEVEELTDAERQANATAGPDGSIQLVG